MVGGRGSVWMEAKKRRLVFIKGLLEKLGEISYTKAVALICYNTGLSENKAKEYLRNLQGMEAIEIRDGLVRPNPVTIAEKETKKQEIQEKTEEELSKYDKVAGVAE